MGGVSQLFAKLAIKTESFEELVEDANELHLEGWGDMLEQNKPPIDQSPVVPYLDSHSFQKVGALSLL